MAGVVGGFVYIKDDVSLLSSALGLDRVLCVCVWRKEEEAKEKE
jgi:hypothetical protein